MKKIVLFPNTTKDPGLRVTERVADTLIAFGAEVLLPEQTGILQGKAMTYRDFPADADLMIVIGGDGTMLDAVPLAVRYGLPLLGVNLGRVGYLAEIEPGNLSMLSSLFDGSYRIREQMLLSVSYEKGAETVLAPARAFNDIIISHDNAAGIASYSVTDQNGECVRYRADGIVVSTPAGSTAYSLSAGGPIVAHGVGAILVTPVCPHTFFNRSILFGADDRIGIRNIGHLPLTVSIDGRFLTTLIEGEGCTVTAAEEKVRMVTLSENSMFSTLFKKMRLLENI